AAPDLAHSVHVEVAGLEPDRVYWYRFRAGGAESPVGRTRTAPAAGTVPDALRFAFASCQNYTQGYYTAHANLAREDLDAVLFLGDYIYEGTARGDIVRDYSKRGWSFTLADYRDRYAQYKTDRDLQAAHASFPWRSEEHTSELQSPYDLVCRLLLEKKKMRRSCIQHIAHRRRALRTCGGEGGRQDALRMG